MWHVWSSSTSRRGLMPGWTWSCRSRAVSPELLSSSQRRLWDIPRDCNSGKAICVVLTIRFRRHVKGTRSLKHARALTDSRAWGTKWDMRECITTAYGVESVRENGLLNTTFSRYRLPTGLQNPRRQRVVHGDIYVWIMHFMWPSSIVWRQSFGDICWAFLAGWLQKSSSQRDTAVISERHTRANWASEHPATLPCSPPVLPFSRCFYFSLLSYISLSVCLSFPLFLSHLSHFSDFSVSFSVFLCILCLETLLIMCNFRIVFPIR